MKRLISIFLAALLVLTFCYNSIVVSAENSGYIGECNWKLNGTVLTISGNGEMGNVSELPWRSDITKVVVEEGVTEIGAHAFYMCESLSEVSLPKSLLKIQSSSFAWCTRLREIFIPKNVSYIDEWAFTYCDGLQYIDVDENNGYYLSDDGVLFNKDKTTLLRYPSNKKGSFYSIPSTVTVIADNAFEDCGYITGFSAPSNITKIGLNAFSYTGYSNDKSNYQNGVLYLGQYVIAVNWNLKETDCVIRDGTTLIADGAVSGWKYLKTLSIPDGVLSIGRAAFNFCESLESIRLPKSIKFIGESAFGGCDSLNNVYYVGDVTDKNKITFEGYNSVIQKTFWNYNACQGKGLHDWKVNSHIEATCSQEGSDQKSCKICGRNETIEYATKQHEFSEWKTIQEATCAKNGTKSRKCSLCGYTEKQSIKIVDEHNYSKWEEDKKPTCTESGLNKRKCTICNDVETVVVDALGHSVKKYTEIKTETDSGKTVMEGVCEKCGEKVSKNISINKENSSDKVKDKTTDSKNTNNDKSDTSWILWMVIIVAVIVSISASVILYVKKKKQI